MDRHSPDLATPQGTPVLTGGTARPIAPRRSFGSRLFGYDIFLSFALGPPPRGTHGYASDLARRLRERDFSVFFSEEEAPPGERLDSTLRKALLRSKTLVVIANRGTLKEPRWVRKEVEEFRENHPDRPVITINIGGALQDATLVEGAQEWLGYEGKIWLDESEEAVATGIANERVVERLAIAPTRFKANVMWRWVVRGVIGILAALAIGLYIEAKNAKDQRQVAYEERDAKETALKGEAEQRAEAVKQRDEANVQRDKAVKNEEEAIKQKDKAGKASAAEKVQRILAEKRMRIAQVRQLAAESQATLESFPQRSLLLGLEALAITGRADDPRVPIAEEVLRQALAKMGGRGLSGHQGPVTVVAISPDNRWLVTGSDDKTARLWDLSAKNPAAASIVLRGHEGSIYAVAISPDNHWLVTGSDDKTARLWDLRIDELVELGCRTAGRNLNEEEWKRYMGNLPYQKTCSKLSIHPSVIEAARDAARRGDIKTAVAQFKKILEIEPDLALKPEEEAKKIYASSMLEEGKSLAKKGKIKEAIADYEKAQQIDPTLNIDFDSWNLLCWKGALTGFAKDVIGACERAVALAPEDTKGQCRDSRGLARALTGAYPGAIEDFKAFVEWSKKDPRYEDYRRKRESWIAALEAGKNPFDQATLEALRKE